MLIDPPGEDTVEISIFGPGKGESIAVHLGGGKWLTVDSCVDQADKSVPVLNYLERIGVNLDTDVVMVVGTHAHDDHIAGISTIFERCEGADFISSQAVTSEEFYSLICADDRIMDRLRKRSYSEYAKIFQIAKSRGDIGGVRRMRRAIENRLLVEIDHGDGERARVWSLSPSDEAVDRSLRAVIRERDALFEERLRVPTCDPNEFSIALWVESYGKSVLLGADLLVGPKNCGWQAILKAFSPTNRADVIKVPHHGAPNAHEPSVWTKLVDENPIALLAPYRAGSNPRPSREDRARILSLTNSAYITASPELLPKSSAVRRTSTMMSDLAHNVRDVWGKSGHVRARSRVGQESWIVDFSAPGRPLVV